MILRPSDNHDDRPDGQTIDTLVIHYTGMKSATEALDRLCSSASMVSAHYMIDEEGLVYKMVEEEDRAWHAGIAAWREHDDLNARSIGIELVNRGHEFGYHDFSRKQMKSLRTLCKEIMKRHPIQARNVVGHSDISPGRKQDPGEKFNWGRMAKSGIGVWPFHDDGKKSDPSPVPLAEIQAMLKLYGYNVPTSGKWDDETETVVKAFQRHFRPTTVDGRADKDTVARLAKLLVEVLPDEEDAENIEATKTSDKD